MVIGLGAVDGDMNVAAGDPCVDANGIIRIVPEAEVQRAPVDGGVQTTGNIGDKEGVAGPGGLD